MFKKKSRNIKQNLLTLNKIHFKQLNINNSSLPIFTKDKTHNLCIHYYKVLHFLLIGTGKVMYFSVFSPKHSNCPSHSSANSLITK